MGEGNLMPNRVVWGAQSAAALLLAKGGRGGRYVKITLRRIAKHTGDNAPLLQCLQVTATCTPNSSVAKRIHIGG